MYKKASQLKLRFQTNRGLLSVEQLWDLSLVDLTQSIKSIKETIKTTNDDDLSFLDNIETVDPENIIKFNILKDVYITRKEEAALLRDEKAIKDHNKKIDAIIANKQEENLQNLSIEELLKLRK